MDSRKNEMGIVIAAIVVICAFALTSGIASAATRVVNQTAPPCATGDAYYATIDAARIAAANDDTIIVCDGTYNESVFVNRRLTIRSQNGSANCIVNSPFSFSHAFEVQEDWVNITGFTVQGASVSIASGIVLFADHCTISNNTALNNFAGINLYESSNNTIMNNTVSNNTNGFYIYGSSKNNISGNIVSNNTNGFTIDSSSNNNISCNWVHHNNQYGFSTFGGTGNKIENNNIMANGVYQVDGSWHYNFGNTHSDNVTAKYNYWGTSAETLINASIYDFYDNPAFGIVDFSDYIHEPAECAPIPEADTILLFSLGLLALAGYTDVQRRRSRK